jgi:hypothetical protein
VPERLEFAAIALSTAVLISASDVFCLQDITDAIKINIANGIARLILLFIVVCFEMKKP